jgi:ElaB/YqjD/DUF883 family membrane-anchored ribosome-binding protein
MAVQPQRTPGSPSEVGVGATGEPDMWDALKAEIDDLSGTVSAMLERRSSQLVTAAQDTAGEVPDLIRRNPWIAVLAAGAAGAAIGLAVTRSSNDSTMRRLKRRARRLPAMASDMADSARHSVSEQGRSMADRLERLAESIANFDTQSANPFMAKAAEWLRSRG